MTDDRDLFVTGVTVTVTCASAHVSLLDEGLEPAAEEDGVVGGVVLDEGAEVLQDGVGVVVGLEEPVRVMSAKQGKGLQNNIFPFLLRLTYKWWT